MSTHISHSALETKKIAKELTKTFVGGDIIILKGNLGAGKTAFSKGIGEELGVEKEVTSPTFTLMSVYQVPNHNTIKELVHVDTYRIETYEELLEIGIEEYLGKSDTVIVIEWPEKVSKLLENKKMIVVTLTAGKTTDRTISIDTIKSINS